MYAAHYSMPLLRSRQMVHASAAALPGMGAHRRRRDEGNMTEHIHTHLSYSHQLTPRDSSYPQGPYHTLHARPMPKLHGNPTVPSCKPTPAGAAQFSPGKGGGGRAAQDGHLICQD